MFLGVVVYANSSASDISLMDWPSSSPSSSSIIVTGIDFPMFALYITKAALDCFPMFALHPLITFSYF